MQHSVFCYIVLMDTEILTILRDEFCSCVRNEVPKIRLNLSCLSECNNLYIIEMIFMKLYAGELYYILYVPALG
jgi:hypothetical protein